MERDQEIFVLDADVLITSARYYPFDLAPGYWKQLVELVNQGRIASIDRVKSEIRNDALAEWMEDKFAKALRTTGRGNIGDAYSQIVNWTQNKHYEESAHQEFASAADGWLVACAMIDNLFVVTNETRNPDGKRIKIPDICDAFDVKCTNMLGMMRRLKIRWT